VTAFVLWLLRQRYRLVILAIAVAPMIPVLAAALITLETIRRGTYQGIVSAAIGATGVLVLGTVVGTDLRLVGVVGVVTMFSGAGLGAIMHSTQSLNLVFQASLLVCIVATVVALSVWPNPEMLVGPQLASVLEMLQASGANPEQLTALSQLADVFFGLVAAVIFAQLIIALALGYWWACLADTPGNFGQEFRQLKLGRSLGWPATLVMAVSWVVDSTLVQNMFPLILFGFCFQGIAITHAWAHAKSWNPAVLLVIYLLLVSPLTAVRVMILGSMGFTDNWINLRAPLRAAT
jgi:hypothetical protein